MQLRQTIEQTILQLFSVYFNVAQLTEATANLQQALSVSKTRQKRAESAFAFGQTNKLAVLNAQVDVTNDSINLLQTRQELDNAKRDLNLILNQPINQDFDVDTEVTFIPEIQITTWIETAEQFNVELMQQRSLKQINAYDLKVSQSGYLPTPWACRFLRLEFKPKSAFGIFPRNKQHHPFDGNWCKLNLEFIR